jgi:hypothetical protein
MPFPNLDPIPLPAPVWIFKALHIVTLSLHFTTIYLLIGGLILATIWNFLGRKDSNSIYAEASGELAGRLPVVMTYLINVGIPPLLFAQVLYGPPLYTSSVLIGAYWIAVILLLMAGYYPLYVAARRAVARRPWWMLTLLSFFLISYIARIYTTNMTLMLRPEQWLELYRANSLGAHGVTMPTSDPTVLPRWLFMMIGSISLSGVAIALLGALSSASEQTKRFLRRQGGLMTAIFLPLQTVVGFWVWRVQPAAVKDGVFERPFYRYSLFLWLAITAVIFMSSVWGAVKASSRAWAPAVIAAATAVLSTGAVVIVRDGIRDVSLLAKGFNVWEQPVTANWPVVVLFLALFVAGLVVIGWMVRVAMGAKGETQSHV